MKRLVALLLILGSVRGSVRAEEASSQDLLVVPPLEARGAANAPESAEQSMDKPAEEPATPPEGGDFPLSRYAALWTRSPFQLESIAPTPQSEGIGQRFALTGIAQIDGEPIVFVMERSTQERSMVKKDGSKAGLSLVQIDVQQKYADSTATVRLDGEVGTIKFDAMAAVPAMPQMGMQPAPRPDRAVPPGTPQAMMVPQPVPGVAQPVAPVVSPGQPIPGAPNQNAVSNGQLQQDSNNAQQGQAPPPRVIRRRAIIPAAP